MWRTEEVQYPPAGSAAAAAPIHERSKGRRCPAATSKLVEDGVPLPPDALGKGEVVVRQIRRGAPVGIHRRSAVEENLAQAVEGRPIERVPTYDLWHLEATILTQP